MGSEAINLAMNIIFLLINRDERTIHRLLDIWGSAVKKTHTFLSDHDIIELKPEVRRALIDIEQLYGCRDDAGVLQGFISVADGKIEMLFVHADARGKGIGKELLNYAINKLGARFVDVNEQNGQGVGFYVHMGFPLIGRSEFDAQGRPFPLLHLELVCAPLGRELQNL